MSKATPPSIFAFVAAAASLVDCASSPAAPFNTMANAQVTALRLQNADAPGAAPAATPGAPAAGGFPMIPGLPPQISDCMSKGPACLGQFIPPGIIPPNLFPGLNPGAPPVAPSAPRFANHIVLSSAPVSDQALRTELANILGDASNFEEGSARCMYPELGLSFAPAMGAPTDDLLISFACQNVQSVSFAWPHPYRGLKPATSQRLAKVVNKLFPFGS